MRKSTHVRTSKVSPTPLGESQRMSHLQTCTPTASTDHVDTKNIVRRKLSQRSKVLETCAKNLSSDEGRIDGQTKWVSSVARSPTPAPAGPTWVQATTVSHKMNVLFSLLKSKFFWLCLTNQDSSSSSRSMEKDIPPIKRLLGLPAVCRFLVVVSVLPIAL